jgi:hypothetical protein
MVTVWNSWPPFSPCVKPLPMCIGIRPRRSGNAKVTRPSPPYIVPINENSAWFWLMGRSCPLQSAHPFGAKLKEISLISAMKGVPIEFS